VDVLLAALLADGEVSSAIAEAGLTRQAIEAALKDVRPAVSGRACAHTRVCCVLRVACV
jgi:hypothetical protein